MYVRGGKRERDEGTEREDIYICVYEIRENGREYTEGIYMTECVCERERNKGRQRQREGKF